MFSPQEDGLVGNRTGPRKKQGEAHLGFEMTNTVGETKEKCYE